MNIIKKAIAIFKIPNKVFLILLCVFFSVSIQATESSSILLKRLLNNPEILTSIKTINRKNIASIKSNLPLIEKEDIGIPVGEDLLLSFYVDKYYVADLFAYKSKKNAQISLISLFEVLDFMIDVDIANKNISGWFINEKNTFELNLPEQEGGVADVSINGKYTTLKETSYFIEGEDIYVDADVIAAWFDVGFTFDFSQLKLQVSSQTPLPIQQKLARSKNKIRKKQEISESTLPWKPSNYQSISTPLLDVQLGGSTNKASNNYGYYSVLGQNDFAYFSSAYYASGNNSDSLTDFRFTLSKEAEAPSLLGPFKATEYQFGDVTPVKTAIGNTADISRGLVFSNRDINQTSNGRTKTFSGDIQPGWDIELYRNNLLIARQVSLTSGRYDFNDIDLLYGDNQFKLVFYGPQGQVRTQSEQIYVGENQLKGQESQYAFSLVEVDKKLFNVSNHGSSKQPGWLSTLTYDYSISDSFSFNSGLEVLFAEEDKNTQVYSIGANVDLFERLLLNIDLQTDQDNHLKGDLNMRTKLGNHAFRFNYVYIDSFQWNIPADVSNSQTTEFDMTGSLFNDTFVPLSYQNNWLHTISENNFTADTFKNQISFSSHIGTIINAFSYYTSNQADEKNVNGSIMYQTRLGPVYSRFQTSYNIQPKFEPVYYSLDLSLPLSNNLDSELGLTYQEETDKYSSNLAVNWTFDAINLNTNVEYDSNDNWSLAFNTRFSFGYEPTAGEFILSNRAFSSNGTLMARVFEDDNLNGTFDEGENTLEGVKVKAVQSRRQAETNNDGVAILKSLPKNKRTDIIVDSKSIEDPFIIPASLGVSITPRTGILDVIDIPMVNAGELEGTVYLRDRQGNEKTGNYITINLKNSEGKVVSTTETEFDGYYLFTDLVPGKYTASIDTRDIKRKKLHDAKALEFDFSAKGDVIAGADFVIDKYTFVEGYVVALGDFNSLSLMKAYWQISKTNYNNALQQQVFYSEDKELQRFQLNAAFFKRKAQAERACDYLQQKNMSCTVKEFGFNL